MKKMTSDIIEKLASTHSLTRDEYRLLISELDDESRALLRDRATKARKKIYGNTVFVRGLIEISNYCKNNCLYCGIRRDNRECVRYRLSEDEILECCKTGYGLGFRTFVMQGGEDSHFTDELVAKIVGRIKAEFPDAAVTLSLGEKSRESYKILREAGADRYLLRHETATSEHYSRLHPKELTLDNRIRCLYDLRSLGYQVGCGFMVGSPYQTEEHIATDLKFIEEFKPDMCGIGPFIPHKNTPFRDYPAGEATLTCALLSIVRLIHPPVLLPATTALGSIEGDGRELGILSGANVIMPNLSPDSVRSKYELYNGKLSSGLEAAEALNELKEHVKSIGYEIVMDRGDVKK